jgi:hypothetical protein
MIIAVAAVRMVQMTVHQIIDMVAMWDRLVATPRTMNMTSRMPPALVRRRALVRVRCRYPNHMLLDRPVRVGVMKMPIVHVVDVTFVLDLRVPTTRPMLMRMVRMTCTTHRFSPFSTSNPDQ